MKTKGVTSKNLLKQIHDTRIMIKEGYLNGVFVNPELQILDTLHKIANQLALLIKESTKLKDYLQNSI